MDKSQVSGSSIVCSCTYSCTIKSQGFLLISDNKASGEKARKNDSETED